MPMMVTAADRALVAEYLARVAKLTPSEWGRLDALGAPVADGTLFALFELAEMNAAAYGMWEFLPPKVATGMALSAGAATQAFAALFVAVKRITDPTGEKTQRQMEHFEKRHEKLEAEFPEMAQMRTDIRTLSSIVREHQRGGKSPPFASAAGKALFSGMIVLRNRSQISPEAFATAYALVEPVIPVSSLEPPPANIG